MASRSPVAEFFAFALLLTSLSTPVQSVELPGSLSDRLPAGAARLLNLACLIDQAQTGELAAVRDLLRANNDPNRLIANLRALRPALARSEQRRYLRQQHNRERRPFRRKRGRATVQPLLASTSDVAIDLAPPHKLTWWLQAGFDDSEQDAADDLDAFEADSQSVALGLERQFGNYNLSASVGYLDGDVDSKRLGDDALKATQLALGISRSFGRSTVAVGVGYTDSETDRLRVVPIQTANGLRAFNLTSDIDAQQLALSIGWSTYFELSERVSLATTANLGYSRLQTDDYFERGAGNLGLEVKTQDTEQLIASLGVSLSRLSSVGDWLVSPSLDLGFDHDLKADAMLSNSRFRGTDFRFTTQGFAVEESRWRAGLGLQFVHLSGFGVSFALETQRKDDYSSNLALIGIQAQF